MTPAASLDKNECHDTESYTHPHLTILVVRASPVRWCSQIENIFEEAYAELMTMMASFATSMRGVTGTVDNFGKEEIF